MAILTTKVDLGSERSLTIETGKMALLAGGAVTVQQGETMVIAAACSAAPRPGLDFFPLQVEYREKFSAAGKMPGGFFKREGRPSEKEILTARMADRPIRPLFPKGYIDDVQVYIILLSADGENESDTLAILGASAALMVSDIPFGGPIGAVRVGRVKGQFVANPTHSERAESDLDLVYAGLADKCIMIEGAADEVSEEVLRDAMQFANEIVKRQIAAQAEMAAKVNKAKKPFKANVVPAPLAAAVHGLAAARMGQICRIPEKTGRIAGADALKKEVLAALAGKFPEISETDLGYHISAALNEEMEHTMRRLILDEKIRMDGRDLTTVRPLAMEVGTLPRTHGSALFARGETQVLVVVTLGTEKDSQEFDAITGGEKERKFLLHYNFPHFSVGETGRIAGPGRREIGHGALAERSVARVVPKDFPYTVRLVSEVMGSNGSTSMGSICAASLALMDAGVPIRKAVAGISCGLVTEGDRYVLLTDIIGSEDHHGDMDFKVAGTRDGITGFQLDLKIAGISIDLMYEAMKRNLTARKQILDAMDQCIATPRAELSPWAPRITVLKINKEKIGALIGPGGKVIRAITAEHDVQIDVEEDGTVKIYATNGENMARALAAVQAVTAEVEIGKIYRGEVKTVKEFGAFVEILPGQDGMLHISEMANFRVRQVEDICNVGDFVTVKVVDIDDRGRVRLSRKAALAELGEADTKSAPPAGAPPPAGERQGGGRR